MKFVYEIEGSNSLAVTVYPLFFVVTLFYVIILTQ